MTTTPTMPVHYRLVLDWLRQDREGRVCEIHVTADDPDYPTDDELGRPATDADAEWTESYQVTLSETGYYGDEEIDAAGGPSAHGGSCTVYQYLGFGDSLDQACAVALAMQKDHTANVLAPIAVVE